MKKSRDFDPAKAFKVCVDMEKAAAEFYAKTAEKAGSPGVSEVLRGMSENAVEHAGIFEKILAGRGSDRKFMKPYKTEEIVAYISHLAGTELFQEKWSSGQFSLKDALLSGREASKTSILFYTELKNLSDQETAGVFERVLKEEKGHYVALSELLEETA
jgi:rubrerythrin